MAPGQEITTGGSVDVTVSAGTQVVVLPDVSQLNLAQATAKLEGLGFKVNPKPRPPAPNARTR